MLPPADRLRAARQFQQVFAGGQSFADGGAGLVVVHVLKAPEAPRQIGFSVGKKVGNAVVRNQVKRRLREAARARLPQLPQGFSAVVVARSKAAGVDQSRLAAALDAALTRAGLLQADLLT
jgi:ribonuclease P protein component